MSQWVGSVTANTINLARVGGGSGLLALVGPLLLIAGMVTAVVAFSAQIEVVLTVLVSLVIAAAVARIAREFAGDKRADRVERRWRRDTAQASLEARRRLNLPQLALEPAPVQVPSYVVDLDREPEPIDLDALIQER